MIFCKETWQVIGADEELYEAFKNVAAVKNVLKKLSSSEAIILNALFTNDFVIKKGSLLDVIPSVDLILDKLKRKALIYMMKNRARLNESLDTIYLNELIKEILLDNNVISSRDITCSDYISLDANLNPDYNTYFDLFRGQIGENVIRKIPSVTKNLVDSFQFVFLVDGFKTIANLSNEKNNNQPLKRIEKFDLLYILCLFLYHIRKKVVKLDDNDAIRKRDSSHFCRIYLIVAEDLELVFNWSVKNSVVELSDGVVKISPLGFSILSCGFQEKVAILSDIVGKYDIYNSIDLLEFYKFLHFKLDILYISDYGLIVNNIKKMANEIRLLYGFGLIQVAYNSKNRVETLQFKRNERVALDKFLIVSPTMDILIYMDRIDSEDLFILRCFSELEIQDNIATGKITEDSVITAIMLGLSGSEFIALLHRGAEKEIAQNVIFILEDWIGSFSDVSLQERFILNGTKQVIELLMHDNKLKQYVDVVLNENYLILKNVDKRVIVDLLENEKVRVGYENK